MKIELLITIWYHSSRNYRYSCDSLTAWTLWLSLVFVKTTKIVRGVPFHVRKFFLFKKKKKMLGNWKEGDETDLSHGNMIEEIFHEFCWDRTVKLQNFIIIPDHFDLLWFTVIWKLGNAFLLKEKAFWWSVRGDNKICWNHILYIDVDVMIFFLYMYSCRYYREYQESSYAILDYTFRITNA